MTAILPEQPVQIQTEAKLSKVDTVSKETESSEQSFESRFEDKIRKLQESGQEEECLQSEAVSELSEEKTEKETKKSEKKASLLRFFSGKEETKAISQKSEKSDEKASDPILLVDIKAETPLAIEADKKLSIANSELDAGNPEIAGESDKLELVEVDSLIAVSSGEESESVKPVELMLVSPVEIKTAENKQFLEKNKKNDSLQELVKKDSPLESANQKDQKSEWKTVVVNDKRTTTATLQEKSSLVNTQSESSENFEELMQKANTETEVNGETLKQAPEVKEMTVFLGENNVSAEGDGGKVQAPVTRLLSQQLKNQTNQDIAKNINFVMKDNNQGEIKLILKPEALGQVKIHLDLNENNIVGRIVVENNSVRQAFNDNLSALSEALKEQGFDNASLDVSVGGRDGEKQQQQGERNQPYYSERLRQWDDGVPTVSEQGIYAESGHIDLVV